MPTPVLIYSNEKGTTVHMVHPHKEGLSHNKAPTENGATFPPAPCMLYWRNELGHTVKLNLLTAIRDVKKKVCVKMYIIQFNFFFQFQNFIYRWCPSKFVSYTWYTRSVSFISLINTCYLIDQYALSH